MKALFISGIGTGIGKTLVSAIVAEALGADYWKPVQAGFTGGTDSEWVKDKLTNPAGRVHAESYILRLAASPHIAAREEGRKIEMEKIALELDKIMERRKAMTEWIVIEGAGGLMVPLNEDDFVIDLVKKLKSDLVLVSRNYLGSINHSLLTARACKASGVPVKGWIFNDQYLAYESEIVHWSGIDPIVSIPYHKEPDREFVKTQADLILNKLLSCL
ncbi:MAG: dethiobiotin synthase [Chitinophagales bacterium]